MSLYFVLDHTEIKPTKAGKPRTYIACNVYRIHEIRPTLAQALADFLRPWTDSQNQPSLPGMMFPEYRAHLFYMLTRTVLSHTTFSLDYEFGKVQVDNTSVTLSKFLQAQNNRRERATLLHPDSSVITPLTLAYYLSLPPETTSAFMRLVSVPVYHVTLPTTNVNGDPSPLAVYSYSREALHKHFNYTTLTDWQVWSKPNDFRATRRFRQMFDPDRSNRLSPCPSLGRMLLNQSWVSDYATQNGFEAHLQHLVDHDLHVQEVAEELLLLQRDLAMPMPRRIGWDEIDQRAAELYPDFRRNQDVYKISEPRFLLDIWGTAYALKVKVLLYPHANPSPLPDVRTNKDDAATSLRGLKNLFNLVELRGDFVFALKVSLVPKDKVVDETTQTLIQRPQRGRGRPKVLKSSKTQSPKAPQPKQPKVKEEVATTPDPNTKFW